jgi:hypothetical protein
MAGVEALRLHSRNSNEPGWLDYSINETKGKLR